MAENTEIEPYEVLDIESRLKMEQEVLIGWFELDESPIKRIDNVPCFEYDVELENGRQYRLRAYLNEGYPEVMPDLVVCKSPEPMPEWGARHDTHTWQPKNGFLRICHWHPIAWNRKNMIFQVFDKGKEWLEAYEKYRNTGKLPLDLQDMELTEEEKIIDERRIAIIRKEQAIIVPFLAITQDPNLVNGLHRWHMSQIITTILSQGLPVTSDEIRNKQQLLLSSAIQRMNQDPGSILEAELMKFPSAITEFKLTNPGSTVNISFSQSSDGRINITFTATTPQSLEAGNTPQNLDIMVQLMVDLFNLHRTIAECKQAYPGCTIQFSFIMRNDGRIDVRINPSI